MKFSKKQCAQCPFRPNALPGWLGSYTPGDVASSVWKGQPFFCHTSVDYEDKRWQEKAMANGKLCTGSLVFAKRMMAPEGEISDPRIATARKAALVVESEIECMGPREFMEHHSNIEASFEKLKKKGIKPAPIDPEIPPHIDLTDECPRFDPNEQVFEFTQKILGSDAWTHLEELLGPSYHLDVMEVSDEEDEPYNAGHVSLDQLIWIAHQPWGVLQPYAREIIQGIDKLGQGALVPLDTMKRTEK